MAGAPLRGGWSPAPHRLLDEASTFQGRLQLQLYLLIHRYANGSRDGCWASVETLAQRAGVHRRSVLRALSALVANGWLQRHSRPGLTSLYRVALPPPPPDAPLPPGAPVPVPPRARVANPRDELRQGLSAQPVSPQAQVPVAPQSQVTPEPVVRPAQVLTGRAQSPPAISAESVPPVSPAPVPMAPPVSPQAQVPVAPQAQVTPEPVAPQSQGVWPPSHRGCDWGATQTRSKDKDPANKIFSPVSLSPGGARAGGQKNGEGTGEEQPARARPTRPCELPVPVAQLPAELQPIAERIEGYWRSKGGSRSPAAFQALLEELSVVAARAGVQAVSQLLRQATQAGWPTVNSQAWLAQHREELAMARHPAYREFRAS